MTNTLNARRIEDGPGTAYAPRVVYKVRSATDADIVKRDLNTMFLEECIYLASPSALNDPFDCRPAEHSGDIIEFLLGLSEKELEPYKLSKRALNALIANCPVGRDRELRDRISDAWNQRTETDRNKVLQQIGLCSFTANPTSSVVWSHYGGALDKLLGWLTGNLVLCEAEYSLECRKVMGAKGASLLSLLGAFVIELV